MSDVGAELAYTISKESSMSFPKFFSELDAKKANLGVLSFGISVTTLEDVFLRVWFLLVNELCVVDVVQDDRI